MGINGYQYRCVASNSAGSVNSSAVALTVTPARARLVNLSVRSNAGTGSQTLVVGFVLGGSGTKQVLVRGVGPTLAQYGVTGVLANPQLTIFDGNGQALFSNSAWGGGATLANAFTQVGAFPLPATSSDAALLLPLAAGVYTGQITATTGTGVALVEAYDADPGTPTARFVNLSARTQAGTGSQTLTAGFVLDGSGTKTLLIRAIGPTLAQYGVTGVLSSPQLVLLDANGQQLYANSGWGGSQALVDAFAQVGAFSLPASSADAALLVTLPAGAYTAQVTGANNATGVALIEVYEMP